MSFCDLARIHEFAIIYDRDGDNGSFKRANP